MPRLIDLSHTITAGMVTYPGLPAPTLTPYLTREASRERYAPGTEFAMDVITMIGNTGTYLDSPFHRYPDGTDLAALDLTHLVHVPARVFHLRDAPDRGAGAAVFEGEDLAGKAVLLDTGWDAHFGTETYGGPAPYLAEDAAKALIDAGVVLVGIDSVNVDDTSIEARGARPAHTLLLGAGVHVVEHLTDLNRLPEHGSFFTAVPPKVAGFGTFPVRAYAQIDDVQHW